MAAGPSRNASTPGSPPTLRPLSWSLRGLIWRLAADYGMMRIAYHPSHDRSPEAPTARPRIQTSLVPSFRSARMLTLDELVRRLSVSRRTVLRRLAEHGYFSSYNHSGRYLTIEEAADFDSRGLFTFKEARFSRLGTLKETVRHFVYESASGMTHEELCELLGVRVHNTLLALTNEGAIGRERLGPVFVYTSAAAEVREAQIRARSSSLGDAVLRPTSRQVIAVLLELLRAPRASREEIVSCCQRSGVRITRQTLDAISFRYDLDEKQRPTRG